VSSLVLLTLSLWGEDIVITPYYGMVKYDNAASKSLKDTAQYIGIAGVFQNKIDKSEIYLLYNHSSIEYKNSTYKSISQHNFLLKYKQEIDDIKFQIGFHYVNSDEALSYVDLGTGYVGIIGLEKYFGSDEDRFSLGIDIYYSAYLNAHDETTLAYNRMVDIFQLSPYLAYSKKFTTEIRNDLSLKMHIIAATQYKNQGYYSYEIEDRFIYKAFYFGVSYIGGEMRSAVLHGGSRLFNTKDLITSYYDCKVGYYFTPTIAADVAFGGMNYQEYDPYKLKLLPSGRNSVATLSVTMTF